MIHGIDLSIIIIYLCLVTGIGLFLSKRASGSIEDYFLGGRSIPWYILGVSGLATFFDITGTMLQVSFFYMLGVKGYWVAYRGAICIFLAFFMIFLGKWLNRSKVMTNAEWIQFRFGKARDGQVARFLNALAMLIVAVPMMAYFFKGSGKFLSMYLPFSPEVCAIGFFTIIMVYTVASGFYGVVFTDLFQSFFILGIVAFITVKALAVGTPEYFAQYATPEWRSILPSWETVMPAGYENMRFLGMLIVFWIISNILQGFAMPMDGWTAQRFYAAKNDRESSLVAWQWISLFSVRFLLMMGMGVLALGIADKISEPEMALPAIINHYIPIGVKGLLLAALFAAAMSTLDSIINSSAAYFVNDIYKPLINPKAGQKRLVRISYVTSFVIVVLGVIIGWTVPNINSIWAWIIMGLLTGMLPPNIFKWFWWRFNGTGYAFGMGGGIIAAIFHRIAFFEAPEYMTFTFVILISSIATLIGTFIGKPTGTEVLTNFYKKTRPFGFWNPVRSKCDPSFISDVKKENQRDLLLLGPACLWLVTLFWMMTAFVAKKWDSFAGALVLVVLLKIVLYKFWYKNLKGD
jgi:Na+/proline symporter